MEGVHLVGLRYAHHAAHSGYDLGACRAGTLLRPPVAGRHLPGLAGRLVDRALTAATADSAYSAGVLAGELAAIAHMARTRRPAVYHVLHADRDLWLLGRAGRLGGHRLVASFHKPPSVLHGLARRHARVARDLDVAVLVSETQRPHLECFLPAERVRVVPLGVDTSFFAPGVPEGGAPGPPLVLTVGSHLRDFVTLAAALEIALRAEPAARVLAVGTSSPSRQADDLAPLLSPWLAARVTLLDRVPDEELRSLYRSASAVVLAFREATASLALLEAMACGAALVVTDVGGVGEYLPAEAGSLCPPGDSEALAAALLEAVGDPAAMAVRRAEARRGALRFDHDRVGEALCEVYERALARP